MPTALVIGARNLGLAIIERLRADGWSVVGAARSAETIEQVQAAGATGIKVDVTDQHSVLAALQTTAGQHGRVDLAVNAASPYSYRGGAFGGGALAEATEPGFDNWAVAPMRGAFAFLSSTSRFLGEQGGPATIVQVTGGSSRRGMPNRGLWAAGAFGVRAMTQAAALELRDRHVHVALLIIDARIDRQGTDKLDSADPPSLADAVAYLASQSPRAMTHELQVTPALDQWVP
jgi:NAD(P)-dependent dehydrogenase (short-subunit alcohol dehydrogenase family)